MSWVEVAAFEPGGLFVRTSGSAGRMTIVPASGMWALATAGGCQRCVAVLRCCTPSTTRTALAARGTLSQHRWDLHGAGIRFEVGAVVVRVPVGEPPAGLVPDTS